MLLIIFLLPRMKFIRRKSVTDGAIKKLKMHLYGYVRKESRYFAYICVGCPYKYPYAQKAQNGKTRLRKEITALPPLR